MPLPPSVSTGTVTGTYTLVDGTAAQGRVSFTPSVRYLLDASDNVILLPESMDADLDVDGSFSIELVATDDPDLNPVDWTWRVDVATKRGGARVHYSFFMNLASGSTVDLADVTPVAEFEGTPVVVGPPGPPGSGALAATGPETIAGVLTTKWVNPAGLAAIPGDISMDPGVGWVLENIPSPAVTSAAADAADMAAGTATDRIVTPANLPFVVVEPSGGDDTAAIQAAADSLAPGGTLVFREGEYSTSDTLTFGNINVQMSMTALYVTQITYSGTGTAVEISGANGCDIRLAIHRASRLWDSTDSTSKGVVIENTYHARFHLDIREFCAGLTLHGDAAGVSYNIFDLEVLDNKTGVKFEQVNSGWTNQNEFHGRVAFFSGAASYVGTVMVDNTAQSNGNTWMCFGFEGSSQETTLLEGGDANVYVGCRWEANPDGSIQFLAGSSANKIIGGYDLVGSAKISDLGTYNDVDTFSYVKYSFGQTSFNDKGMVLKGEVGNPVVQTVMQGAETQIETFANGDVVWYVPAGKESDATQIMKADANIRGFVFGVAGTPDVARVYCYNAQFLGIKGHIAFSADNTYDIGIAGVRPRDITLGRNANIGGALNHDGTTAGFYGATPVVKAASPGVAAGTDATVINAIITALRNLGLVT